MYLRQDIREACKLDHRKLKSCGRSEGLLYASCSTWVQFAACILTYLLNQLHCIAHAGWSCAGVLLPLWDVACIA